MRARARPDDRVAEAAQRRLEALVAELGGGAPVRNGTPVAEDGQDDEDGQDGQDGQYDQDGERGLDGQDGQDGQDDEDGAAAELRAPYAEPDGRGRAAAGEEEALGRHARRPLSGSRRAASWAGDRLPAEVAGLRFGARHVGVIAVLLVTGLLLAGWTYVQATRGPVSGGEVVAPRASGGVQVEVPPASTGVSPHASGGATGQPAGEPLPGTAAADGAEVVVDVEGKVRRPGIAVLPPGSRVVDALKAAGGARPGADLQALNLARLLVDGEQLLVGVDPAAGVAAESLTGPSAAAPTSGVSGPAGSAPVALVDLNTADQAALETLPGVGPVTAAAILEWRTQHGAFTSVDELLEVSGIGDATLAEIAPHVTL